MSINLEKLTLDQLKELKKDVEVAIRGFEKRRKKEALIAAQKVAQEHGFTLEEILGEKSASKGLPKYANPANPDQTWTGRGRQPAWVKDALTAGKSIEDLAI